MKFVNECYWEVRSNPNPLDDTWVVDSEHVSLEAAQQEINTNYELTQHPIIVKVEKTEITKESGTNV